MRSGRLRRAFGIRVYPRKEQHFPLLGEELLHTADHPHRQVRGASQKVGSAHSYVTHTGGGRNRGANPRHLLDGKSWP